MYSIVLVVYLGLLVASCDVIKINYMSSAIALIAIACLFVFNRQNNDYNGYVEIFNNPALYAEVGFSFLVGVVKFFSGNYNHILLILGVFVAITFYRFSDYSNFMGFALLCYIIFPMTSDIIQIRNTFALLFFLNALIEISRNRYLFSFVFVFLSISFHLFSFVYLLIIFGILFRDIKRFNFYVLFFSLISVVCFPIALKLATSVDWFRSLNYYLSGSPKIHSIATWGVVLVLDILVFSYFIKRLSECDEKTRKLIVVLNTTLCLFAVFLSGLLYVDEFNRLFRTAFIVKYLLAALVIPHVVFRDKAFLIFYVLVGSIAFGFYYSIQLDSDYILFGLG